MVLTGLDALEVATGDGGLSLAGEAVASAVEELVVLLLGDLGGFLLLGLRFAVIVHSIKDIIDFYRILEFRIKSTQIHEFRIINLYP